MVEPSVSAGSESAAPAAPPVGCTSAVSMAVLTTAGMYPVITSHHAIVSYNNTVIITSNDVFLGHPSVTLELHTVTTFHATSNPLNFSVGIATPSIKLGTWVMVPDPGARNG